jgi:RNA polymerase sigma-70 factor (ECF subfamily)
MQTDPERVLVKEAQEGSRPSFVELLRMHQGRVRAYLLRYVRDREVREDLAQETFLAAFRDLAAYKGEAPFGIWLLSIARNRTLDYLRREETQRSGESRLLEAAVARWRAEDADRDRARLGAHDRELSALQKCCRELPETSAQLLGEHYFRGKSLQEIARRMEKTEGSVKMALFRIREAIRQCVEQRLLATGTDHE